MGARVRAVLVVVPCVAALLLAAAPAFAQDPLEFDSTRTNSQHRDWGLAVTPYAWLAAQSTDVGTAQLRQSFNDLASITNVGFQARVLANWRWVLFAADWTYAELENEQQVGPVTVAQSIRQNILDMKLGGKVYDTRTSDLNGGIGIWASAGARYWDNGVNLDITTQPIPPGGTPTQQTLQDQQSWWDPVLGLTLHFPVTPKISFLIRTTGGGFSIGNASTYMWDAEVGALFRMNRMLRIDASYREFKYNRTDGEGSEAVEQTVTVFGPCVGLSIGIF